MRQRLVLGTTPEAMKFFAGKVEDLSSEGLGVVKHPDGMTFFVEDAWPGDAGEFEIINREKRYGFAKWKERTETSPDRVTPPCPYLGFEPGKCGGCSWMMASYEKQLEYKDKYVATLLRKFHYEISANRIHGSEKQFGFRNRAQLKVNGKQVGYVSPKSRVLAPIESCIILNEPTHALLEHIRDSLPNKEWAPEGRYLWNFVDIDEDMKPKDIELNRRRPFKQANRGANNYMRHFIEDKIKEYPRYDQALELFCGSGNFTEILSPYFQTTLACELPGNATRILRERNLKGVDVIETNVFAQIEWPKILEKAKNTQVLFLDPPREGFKDLALFVERLPRLEKIIYVSCDPYTFAANCKPLTHKGWRFREVQPVDQFPHTPHLELIALLEK